MTDAAREILITGARALARRDALGPSLDALVAAVAGASGAGSAAVFLVGDRPDRLDLAASFGLPDAAADALTAAVANPGHPIARTARDAVSTFDVPPTAPGGPALRSHLPLVVRSDGRDLVVGVLALAHDRPTEPAMREVIQAGADLAAVAVERAHVG